MSDIMEKVSAVDAADAVALAMTYLPKVKSFPMVPQLRVALLGKNAYDVVDYVGEATGVFNLPDSNKIIAAAAGKVGSWINSVIGKGTPEVKSLPESTQKAVKDAFGGDVAKADAALAKLKEDVSASVSSQSNSYTAWAIFELYLHERSGSYGGNLLKFCEVTALRRFLADIPVAAFASGMERVATWYAEHIEATGSQPQASYNPFNKTAQASMDRIYAHLTPIAAYKS